MGRRSSIIEKALNVEIVYYPLVGHAHLWHSRDPVIAGLYLTLVQKVD